MNNNFALILMDLQMPIMGGYEAAVKIREKNIDIPIIAKDILKKWIKD